MTGRATAKLRTFFVGDRLFDVEMSLPSKMASDPITYVVDWSLGTKLVFNAPRIGMHQEVLLAALDQLEENGELDMELATTPINQIIEV